MYKEVAFGVHVYGRFYKLLAYTLNAYCHCTEDITQPDASSKRYLEMKSFLNSCTLHAAVIGYLDFRNKVNK